MEIGPTAFEYWLEVLFGLIIAMMGWGYRILVKKFKKMQTEQIATKLGIQALLRDRIIGVYNHYSDKGFCPIYALENVLDLYKEYQALGGNGAVTKLMEDLIELPTQKERGIKTKEIENNPTNNMFK